jgi:hypothetical protein
MIAKQLSQTTNQRQKSSHTYFLFQPGLNSCQMHNLKAGSEKFRIDFAQDKLKGRVLSYLIYPGKYAIGLEINDLWALLSQLSPLFSAIIEFNCVLSIPINNLLLLQSLIDNTDEGHSAR